MFNKILDIILLLINLFKNKFINKRQQKQIEVQDKKDEAMSVSVINKIAKNAESEDLKTREKAIEDMRKLIAE